MTYSRGKQPLNHPGPPCSPHSLPAGTVPYLSWNVATHPPPSATAVPQLLKNIVSHYFRPWPPTQPCGTSLSPRSLREPLAIPDLTSSLQYEMLLLTDSISKEDSFWELRLGCVLSLFLMALNIKTPMVVENIILMCLQILQKLIKPPAPTSKKNKDVLVEALTTVKPYCNEIPAQAKLWLKRDLKASYDAWKKCLPIKVIDGNGKAHSKSELYLTEKYAAHQAACTIVEAQATIPSHKQQVLDLLASYLGELSIAGECAAEYLALYQKLITSMHWKDYLAAWGVLRYVGNLIPKEIGCLLPLEEATLSTDLQQGYALKSLTGLLSSLVELVMQRTKLIDEMQNILLEMLEDMSTGTESETKAFMAMCIETAKRYNLDDY
ncbi:E3 ubiquitin-protein ligase ubr4 [Saguinus oedipus]|uniref:E3 ubiquitin-protein ligase ubr4 n=1 Tax=Saguinus oedipus TaxID=9490 RepID=A0ABQ9VZ12_SAGOE|nr:E3 ubiquitin-protein ligase ubr4 [Saguinus oedipus]